MVTISAPWGVAYFSATLYRAKSPEQQGEEGRNPVYFLRDTHHEAVLRYRVPGCDTQKLRIWNTFGTEATCVLQNVT